MKIKLLQVGRTTEAELDTLIQKYGKRIGKYCDFKIEVIPDLKLKGTDKEVLMKKEGEAIIARLASNELVILLHVEGEELSSTGFSAQINQWMVGGRSRFVFVIGGAYGFSDEVLGRANYKLSLSSMTFSHQLVRVIFVEQLYRAFTILRNEPYHH